MTLSIRYCLGPMVLSMVILISSTAFGADLPALEDKISQAPQLSDLVSYAQIKNPSLAAHRALWQAAIQAQRLGTAYPDPKLTTTFFPQPIETRLGPQDFNITLGQPIPFPGLLNKKRAVLASNATLARLKGDQELKSIIGQIALAYYELAYIHRAMELTRENLKLNRQMEMILKEAYGRDQSLFHQMSKTSIRISRLENQIHGLKERETTEKNRLNGLLNRPPMAPIGPLPPVATRPLPPPLPYTLDQLQTLGITQGETIRMAREKIKGARARVEMARYENKPALNLGLFYAAIGKPDTATHPRDAGTDALGIQLGISMPLWSGKQKSRKSRFLQKKIQAQREGRDLENRIKTRITRLWFDLNQSRRNFNLQKDKILPQSRRALETAHILFRQGKGGLSDLLDLQTAVHDDLLAMARARIDHAKARALLDEQAGPIWGPSSPIMEPR